MLNHLVNSIPASGFILSSESIEELAENLTKRINLFRLTERKCLFYDVRVCHVREQMNISDVNLREDKVFKEREVAKRLTKSEADVQYDVRRYTRNIADWLVSNFCQICPHREA